VPVMGGFPRTWGNRECFTDEALQLAAIDVPNYIIKRLRFSFDEAKEREGWPENAVPEWEIRWTYNEEWADPLTKETT
jgi:hypothetical protein